MRYKDKKEARLVNNPSLKRPKGVSDEQWDRALDLYEIARKKGDKFPELTVAQAALETGWFKHMSGNYNYFGQKASKYQKGSTKVTKEFEGNKSFTIVDKFRDYDSLEVAIDDRLKKWGSKYKGAASIDEAIGSIWQYDPETGKGKGYATDINYDTKIKKILGMMGVNSQEKNNTNTTVQRKSIDFSETRSKVLLENQVKIDNTDVNIAPVQKVLEPLVTNNVNIPTQSTADVDQARAEIQMEESKYNFAKQLLQASQVQFIEPTVTEQFQTNFQEGGKFDSDQNQKNFEEFYFPIYDKFIETTPTMEGEDKFPKVHPTVDGFVEGVMGASRSDLLTGKRTVPPMDEDLKKLQDTILNMTDEELREIMSKDFGDINMFNFKKFLPEGVGTFEALGLLKKYKNFQKEGYTFEGGGSLKKDINRDMFLKELSRLYRNENSRVKSALKFNSVAGKRINKTKIT